jgi:hypothetical protein
VGKPLDDGLNLDRKSMRWVRPGKREVFKKGYDSINWPQGKTKMEKRLEEDICQKK